MMISLRRLWLVSALGPLGCSGASAEMAREAPRLWATEPSRAIAIVRIHAPWYAPRFAIAGRFRDAVPEYERIPNLEGKYFTLTEERLFGGIYVWRSRADATGYHGDAWREGIRKRRGALPDLVILDSPFTVEGSTSLEGDPVGERGVRSSATAALVLWQVRDPKAATLLAANLARLSSGHLVRAYVVTAGPDRAGFVGLWPASCDASTATNPAHLDVLTKGFDAAFPEVTFFDTPVMIDDARCSSRANHRPS